MNITELADRSIAAANGDQVLEVTPEEMHDIRTIMLATNFEQQWIGLVVPRLQPDKVGVQLHVKVIEPEVGEITGTAIDMGKAVAPSTEERHA